MNPVLAGILAAIPLSLLGILYMLLRGRALVQVLQTENPEAGDMTTNQWFILMFGALALAPFLLGILSGLIFRWLGNPPLFMGIALGAATLFTILAWVSRTPMPGEKTVMNWLVALDFGLLMPFLTQI